MFNKWMCDKTTYGILKQNKFWDVNVFGWGPEDLAPNEQIYRSPFDLYESLMKTPLLNNEGKLINSTGEAKSALRNAYKAIGTHICEIIESFFINACF